MSTEVAAAMALRGLRREVIGKVGYSLRAHTRLDIQ
jgi:hypothetical protein